MSDYTIVNLREVEDSAERFGFAPNIQSRFARTALGMEKGAVSHFTFAPGYRMPFGHTHAEQEEVYVVVSGSVRMKIGDEIRELQTWDAARIPGPVPRGIEGGPEGAVVIAFGAPNTDNKDAELAPGFWED